MLVLTHSYLCKYKNTTFVKLTACIDPVLKGLYLIVKYYSFSKSLIIHEQNSNEIHTGGAKKRSPLQKWLTWFIMAINKENVNQHGQLSQCFIQPSFVKVG